MTRRSAVISCFAAFVGAELQAHQQSWKVAESGETLGYDMGSSLVQIQLGEKAGISKLVVKMDGKPDIEIPAAEIYAALSGETS